YRGQRAGHEQHCDDPARRLFYRFCQTENRNRNRRANRKPERRDRDGLYQRRRYYRTPVPDLEKQQQPEPRNLAGAEIVVRVFRYYSIAFWEDLNTVFSDKFYTGKQTKPIRPIFRKEPDIAARLTQSDLANGAS